MAARTGRCPWSGQDAHIQNVDLVKFFQYVRNNHINFANKTVEEVSGEVQTAGEIKQEMPNQL